tara:strand:- start:1415 stop:2470 length:1056 start_codon:yes stop_codon:yes gene_type:complete
MSNMKIKVDPVIVKRLLMRIDPLFFTYEESKQNKERQSYFSKHYDVVTEFLFKHVLKLVYEQDAEIEDTLTSMQLGILNAYVTALTGIGKNSFVFNEFQSKDFDLTRYSTLYDFDFQEFHYQQNAFKEHSDENFIEKPYRLHLNHNWVRLFDLEGHFRYSTQSSLSHYLIDKLSEHASDKVDQLIPHHFVEGPDNDKKVEGGYLYDYRLDANGLEQQLDELKSRYRDYLGELKAQLDDAFDEDSECAVYLQESDIETEHHLNVIIKNAHTAKFITFKNYLQDCQQFLKTNEQIECLYQIELKKLDNFINDNYHDVMENLDTKIILLKQKTKIILSPDAIEDMAKIRDGDEK